MILDPWTTDMCTNGWDTETDPSLYQIKKTKQNKTIVLQTPQIWRWLEL